MKISKLVFNVLLTLAIFLGQAQAEISPKSRELNEKGATAIKNQDYQKAEELFRQAYTSDSGNATAGYNLAGAYIANKKENLAIIVLTDLIKKNPKDAALQARLGDAFFSFEKPKEALGAYSRALEIDPKNPRVLQKIGVVYSLLGKLQESEDALLKAVEIEPNNYEALSNLANVFLANSKSDKAISTAKRALQVKVTSEMYLTLGNAYEFSNDLPNALLAFQKAVGLGNLGKQTEVVQKKITGLESVQARAKAK